MEEQQTEAIINEPDAEGEDGRQYLTFRLGGEIFALDIERVREVLDPAPITRVPGGHPLMRGVFNLRGTVMPVAEIRPWLGLDAAGDENGCFIIIDVAAGEDETATVGVIADQVIEVVGLVAEEIDQAPKVGARVRPELVHGIGKRHGHFFMILNIDALFKGVGESRAAAAAGNDMGGV